MQLNKIIRAIVSGSATAIEQASKDGLFESEQWSCAPNGNFINKVNGIGISETEFISYCQTQDRSRLIFLSTENLTDEQIKKFVKHE